MYRSRAGRTYTQPYPYVRYCNFSEFDIEGVKAALEESKKKGSVLGSFENDMSHLAFLCAREGTNLKKITVKKSRRLANERAQTELRTLLSLIKHYTIVQIPKTTTDITLWRLGALFCKEICSFFHEGKIMPFLTQEQLGLATTGGFPAAMMHLSFGQFIPSNSVVSDENYQNNAANARSPTQNLEPNIGDANSTTTTSNVELCTPLHPFNRTKKESKRKEPNKASLSPEDYECLYYGYAYHQKIFYQVLTSTTKGRCPKNRKTLKPAKDILNYLDEQIAYPVMTDLEKIQYLEKLKILVKCDSIEEDESFEGRTMYYLESTVKFALKRCKDAWLAQTPQTDDQNGVLLAFELVDVY